MAHSLVGCFALFQQYQSGHPYPRKDWKRISDELSLMSTPSPPHHTPIAPKKTQSVKGLNGIELNCTELHVETYTRIESVKTKLHVETYTRIESAQAAFFCSLELTSLLLYLLCFHSWAQHGSHFPGLSRGLLC